MKETDLDMLAALARHMPEDARPAGLICIRDNEAVCFTYDAQFTDSSMRAILNAAAKSIKTEKLN